MYIIYMDNINNLARQPISDRDILSKIRTNVVTYKELGRYRRIDDILRDGSAVILYPNKRSRVGHWVCLIKTKRGLEFFDSYGRIPDHPIYETGLPPYLSKLLYESRYPLEYNEFNFQEQGFATCGRHCIVRILLKDYSLEEYHKFMKIFQSDDQLVTVLTMIDRSIA